MFPGKGSRSQTSRRLVQIFTPAALDDGEDGDDGSAPATSPQELRAWWEWAILLLAASAGAIWSAEAGSFERALPFCAGAALGVALAIFARGNASAAAWLLLGGAGWLWPETARVPWILGGTLGLVLANRAPVALLLAGAGALAVFWIREAREQPVPWLLLGAIIGVGLVLAALMEVARPKNKAGFWPLGAMAIVGGALFAQTLAQGAGVASFALGGALWGVLNSATRLADEAADELQNGWSVAAIIALWRVLEAQVPALRFGADAGDLTVLWGALLSVAIVSYQARALAPLVGALAPIFLWFVWGPKVVPGLFLGATLAPLFEARALPMAAIWVCALVGLAPFVEELPPLTRAEKLMVGAALVALWLALDAILRWFSRERAP